MRKAVLVIDMPEKCTTCNMYIEDDELFGIGSFCCAEQKEIPSEGKAERAYWCPLKPLPEKRDEGYHGSDYVGVFNEGWNACLDGIGGGGDAKC